LICVVKGDGGSWAALPRGLGAVASRSATGEEAHAFSAARVVDDEGVPEDAGKKPAR
jgi:hypothetical protein